MLANPLMIWKQSPIQFRSRPRGFHLVTRETLEQVDGIDEIFFGFFHLFLQHTSASLSLNENADPDVRADMELAMNHLCPESLPYCHTCEGPDDMPAHVKSSLIGPDLTIPIRHGELALGTWQGIYLCEHRDHGGRRRALATVWGQGQ